MTIKRMRGLIQKNTSKYTKLTNALNKIQTGILILLLIAIFLKNGPIKSTIVFISTVEMLLSLIVLLLDYSQRIRKGEFSEK